MAMAAERAKKCKKRAVTAEEDPRAVEGAGGGGGGFVRKGGHAVAPCASLRAGLERKMPEAEPWSHR